MAGKYDDYDWDELPADAKKAAKTLGYTKDLWDNDGTPEDIDDADWKELNKKQQDAATVLGYTKAAWDAEP
eukprot:CAMPEP_0197246526 /NCGR_PEP_ID=MMETSP1429-20130617/15270_1 /TAXON_ID=49237 /ORGANISM="Chaetoceros  sp., Strain UNC1202" /LENGTH=70 /DNA_ID=CAMNT_0042707201 /DNA_START=78 /DNA_END=290 /DNA_ORIENTATION=+